MLKLAEDWLRSGDEEQSYVYFMKYLNLVSLIRKTDLYRKDAKHFNLLIGPQKVKSAINQVEELQSRLRKRYDEKLEEEDVRLKLAALEAKENRNKTISEPPKVITIAPAENVEKKPSFLEDKKTISAWELDNLMKQKCTPYLVFDIRTANDYLYSHIKDQNCYSIPEPVIKKGISAAMLENYLPPDTKQIWPRRLTVELIIFVDWHGEQKPDSTTTVLEEIMTKWDPLSVYKGRIKVLERGYEDWLLRFPIQTTNPLAAKPESNNHIIADPTPLLNFDYPDLDEELNRQLTRVEPSTSPVITTSPFNGIPTVNRLVKPSAKISVDSLQDQIMNAAREALVPEPETNQKQQVASVPVIDRRFKAQALLKYSSLNKNRSEVLQAEEDLVEDSLRLAKNNLEKEMEWKMLCLKREANAEGELRAELQKKELELLERLEQAEADYKRQEAENAELRSRLEKYISGSLDGSVDGSVREEAQIKERIDKKTEEKRKLDEEVEKLRRMRKEEEEKKRLELLEQARKAKEKEETERRKREEADNERKRKEEADKKRREAEDDERRKREKPGGKAIEKASLKDEPSTPGLSKLSRAHSTPNIAQMFQNEEPDESKIPKTPRAQRALKPLDTGRNQIIHRFDNRQRNFAPVYGRVGRALAGLKNLGNTCYMNSIIQCLNNITGLAMLCVDGSYREYLNKTNKTKGEIAEELAAVVRALWSGEYRVIACKDFKAVVGKHKPSFRGSDQQDSHEFLTILVDWLHEDLNEVKIKAPLKEQNNDNVPDHEAADAAWNDYKKSNKSVIVALFGGQQKSSLKCRVCGAESATFEPFFNLSLPIPSTGNSCSLQDCFQLYTKPESVSGWHCPRCKQKREAVKQIQIWRLPPILVIHLQRFYNDGMWRKKLTKVDFSISDMNLGTLILNKASYNQKFNLLAISNHYGTMDGGHYTAYCKNAEYNRWFKFDDQDVSEISENEVRSSAAYILFYTAVNYEVPRIIDH